MNEIFGGDSILYDVSGECYIATQELYNASGTTTLDQSQAVSTIQTSIYEMLIEAEKLLSGSGIGLGYYL